MNYKTPYSILSAESHKRPIHLNEISTDNLRRNLDFFGLAYKEVEGHFNGYKEVSFIITGTNGIEFARQAMKVYGQLCILISDCTGRCELEFRDGTFQALGRMIEITKEEALNKQNYTYDKTTNKYWITNND